MPPRPVADATRRSLTGYRHRCPPRWRSARPWPGSGRARSGPWRGPERAARSPRTRHGSSAPTAQGPGAAGQPGSSQAGATASRSLAAGCGTCLSARPRCRLGPPGRRLCKRSSARMRAGRKPSASPGGFPWPMETAGPRLPDLEPVRAWLGVVQCRRPVRDRWTAGPGRHRPQAAEAGRARHHDDARATRAAMPAACSASMPGETLMSSPNTTTPRRIPATGSAARVSRAARRAAARR